MFNPARSTTYNGKNACSTPIVMFCTPSIPAVRSTDPERTTSPRPRSVRR